MIFCICGRYIVAYIIYRVGDLGRFCLVYLLPKKIFAFLVCWLRWVGSAKKIFAFSVCWFCEEDICLSGGLALRRRYLSFRCVGSGGLALRRRYLPFRSVGSCVLALRRRYLPFRCVGSCGLALRRSYLPFRCVDSGGLALRRRYLPFRCVGSGVLDLRRRYLPSGVLAMTIPSSFLGVASCALHSALYLYIQ